MFFDLKLHPRRSSDQHAYARTDVQQFSQAANLSFRDAGALEDV